MKKAVLYVHGKGGNAGEAEHYKPFFAGCDVVGMDYKSEFPWETKNEILDEYERLTNKYSSVIIVANSIGAYFTMNALQGKSVERAFFISPIVDMERLITDMMSWANVTESELREKQEIITPFGETLSWKYQCYVRENPIVWKVPTDILYAENDNLTAFQTVSDFANRTNASLTVMSGGEHWFHTKEQMNFLDEWLTKALNDSSEDVKCT